MGSYFQQYILSHRYLQPNETTFEDICIRVAHSISNNPSEYKEFFEILSSKQFLPGGRTIANAGTDKALIPNCVVLPIEDSLESIFDTLKRAAILQQAGCGLGFDFSNLRPAGIKCKRTGGEASGPNTFLNLYSLAFKVVQQFNRSGANMGILRIDHPDILAFIHLKDNLNVIHNFNISVMITEEFMNNLFENPNSLVMCYHPSCGKVKPQKLTFTDEILCTSHNPIDITYKELFDELINSSWMTGEPGFLFDRNINIYNNLHDMLGPIKAVNPCGEITLYPNECCNLGSINLSEFYDERTKSVDFVKLKHVSKISIKFMNNVLDKMNIPDEKLRKFVLILRRLGLGIMGLADLLFKMNVSYASEEGRDLTAKILLTINESAHEQSRDLLNKYGSVYERLSKYNNKYSLSSSNDFISKHANCALTCIAPTGSTSMIHNVSSGIEPVFSLAYKRTISGQIQPELIICSEFKKYIEMTFNESIATNIIERVVSNNGSCQSRNSGTN